MTLKLAGAIFCLFAFSTSYSQQNAVSKLVKSEISKFINVVKTVPKTSNQQQAFNKINSVLRYKLNLPEKYGISATKSTGNSAYENVSLLVSNSTGGFTAQLVFMNASEKDLLPEVSRILGASNMGDFIMTSSSMKSFFLR